MTMYYLSRFRSFLTVSFRFSRIVTETNELESNIVETDDVGMEQWE